MAYTIIKSDGTVLTTIPDSTINTTSMSLALPGRNYSGWGQSCDTNFVHLTENFADNTPPPNPLKGQIWCDTSGSTVVMRVCPADGETNAAAWSTLSSTSIGGTNTFGAITVTGNITANNITATNTITANAFVGAYLDISAGANIANANLTGITTIANTFTTVITTGSASTPGSMTGAWTLNGSGAGGNAFIVTGGNLFINPAYGIRTDNYYYANGVTIPIGSSYGDANVAAYLPTYNGNVGGAGLNSVFNGRTLSTGASTTAGSITGNWTLTAGSRLQATYADLAERYEIDQVQPVGTVVRVGGTNEITVADSEHDVGSVLGVISDSYAFLMNAEAGSDISHPAVALIGRVNVRVVGPVEKGDRITIAGAGAAKKSTGANGFGIALETNNAQEEKLVLCVIK
jgi:hypothetical protein